MLKKNSLKLIASIALIAQVGVAVGIGFAITQNKSSTSMDNISGKLQNIINSKTDDIWTVEELQSSVNEIFGANKILVTQDNSKDISLGDYWLFSATENSKFVDSISLKSTSFQQMIYFNEDGEQIRTSDPLEFLSNDELKDPNSDDSSIKIIRMGYSINENTKYVSPFILPSNIDTSSLPDLPKEIKSLSQVYCVQDSNNNSLSKKTIIVGIFGNSNVTSLDLSKWDTSNIVDMSYAFSGLSNLTDINLGNNFVGSSVRTMAGMFVDDTSLTSIDLSNWDTSNVENITMIFSHCKSLTSIDLSNWDTSNITNMSSMFESCSSLSKIDLSSFNTSNVTNMHAMFSSSAIKELILNQNSFDTSKVTDMAFMFSSTPNLTSLDLSGFNTSNVTNMYAMFSNSALTSLDLSSFNTLNVTDMSLMFAGVKLSSLKLSDQFSTSNVTNMYAMFSNASIEQFDDLNLSKFNTSNVIDMSYMFCSANISNLQDILSNLITSNVIDMSFMFSNTKNLLSLDLSNFNTSQVTNMKSMFHSDGMLTEIKLGTNWDTSQVTNMESMFNTCVSLNLDLSEWNVDNVKNHDQIIFGVNSGTIILPEQWEINK